MNVRQIEAFHAVIETGSATRAAERLGITQPAISKLLKSFTLDCGFALFERRGGQMVPTREAEILATEVAKVFHGAKRIKEVARAVRDHEWGEISIAAPPAFSVRFIPSILAKNMKRLDLRIQVLSRSSPSILDMVATQQVDLGLSTIPVDHPQVSSEHLITFPLVCMLPANHPLADTEELHINDIRSETFIALPSSDCSFTRADRVFQILSAPSRGRIEVPYSETAAMLVAEGAGVTIVPPFVGLDLDNVVRRPLQPAEHVDVWLLKPKLRHSPLVVNLLADLLRDIFSNLATAPASSIHNGLKRLVGPDNG
jgi:DNA-binding transcriptional LysR family regulator